MYQLRHNYVFIIGDIHTSTDGRGGLFDSPAFVNIHRFLCNPRRFALSNVSYTIFKV